jgi:hypothetical protein
MATDIDIESLFETPDKEQVKPLIDAEKHKSERLETERFYLNVSTGLKKIIFLIHIKFNITYFVTSKPTSVINTDGVFRLFANVNAPSVMCLGPQYSTSNICDLVPAPTYSGDVINVHRSSRSSVCVLFSITCI